MDKAGQIIFTWLIVVCSPLFSVFLFFFVVVVVSFFGIYSEVCSGSFNSTCLFQFVCCSFCICPHLNLVSYLYRSL